MSLPLPTIIQGGMGVAISDWRLAKTVSQLGQLGVVSGTGISCVLTRRLMDGDLAGNMRRAIANFSLPEAVQDILDRYFIPGGKAPDAPYKSTPTFTLTASGFIDRLNAIANFVEVFLAKENHNGVVGINLLEKVQMPTLVSLYGAMLAGVDYVLMGAGIPTQIAGILDRLSNHQPVSYRLDVQGAAPDDDVRVHFDPEKTFPGISKLVEKLKRPKFLPIISSSVLAQVLLKRSEGAVDGFVIEASSAGGHNAPPRGAMKLSNEGEPIYGEKDTVGLDKIRQLGIPFWLAGAYGHSAQLKKALAEGAAGIQVGTAFALCEESGMESELKKKALQQVLNNEARVFTNPIASPTGFPFKIAHVDGTISEKTVFDARKRLCDISMLRTLFKKDDGSVGYRCPAEPEADYVRKGGMIEDTVGRTCLCNNLMAAAGIPQHRKDGYIEPPLVTAGDDLANVGRFVKKGNTGYTAKEVIDSLLGEN
ncbi:nitronate monooxygenase [bacterium]|nr:nitronate monooxygenase [bacterium]